MTTATEDKGMAERSMGFGLRWLNRLAGSDLLDRIRIRKQVERALFTGTKNGFRSATAAGRTFKAAQKLRPGPPDAEQAAQPLRRQPRRRAADVPGGVPRLRRGEGPPGRQARPTPTATTPPELLAQANELGVNMLGVPEELGGVMHEQAAVTSVLIGEALAHGDMGIAYAALAPGAVATAIGHWGTRRAGGHLPARLHRRGRARRGAGDARAPAALRPAEAGDQGAPATAATGSSTAPSRCVARAAECELFVVAAEAEGLGPALFVIESGAKGLSVEAGAGDGPAPRRHRPPAARGRAPARQPPCSARASARTTSSASARSRIAWCSLAVGTAQAVLDYVIPYVNERTAFGEPISNRQAVAFGVSDIGIETDGMRLATYRAASRADHGEDFAREAALARRLCAAKGMQIGSEGVQLLGGHGFVKEHPVERWYRDLRAAGVMEGALLV